MKKIIYSNPGGSVHVVTPAPKDIVAREAPSVRGMTEEQFLSWIANKDVPRSATNVTVIEGSTLPPRTNRDLWRWDGTRITVNGVPVSTPSGIKIR